MEEENGKGKNEDQDRVRAIRMDEVTRGARAVVARPMVCGELRKGTFSYLSSLVCCYQVSDP